jgi:hypothetical protein
MTRRHQEDRQQATTKRPQITTKVHKNTIAKALRFAQKPRTAQKKIPATSSLPLASFRSFAVVLSAAKDPNKAHSPNPPSQPLCRCYLNSVKPPNPQNPRQTREITWRSSSTRSAILDTEDKESPEIIGAFLSVKMTNSFRKKILPVTHLE